MNFWYKKSLIAWLLAPFTALFWFISQSRRFAYRKGFLKSYRPDVPVIVVGNLSVGGNGKTPLVIWLADYLGEAGLKVGIISRGYGSKSEHYPLTVTESTDAKLSGDEPLLIARRTGAPVVISANRKESCEQLCREFKIDIIISDDGLQHYALQRDYELVVVDGKRLFGNGWLMPSGPLRELTSRLKSVDGVIYNSNHETSPRMPSIMQLKADKFINLSTRERCDAIEFSSNNINAMAGIGYPQRFFDTLQGLGITVNKQVPFTDHATLTEEELAEIGSQDNILLMTEKDAVKCQHFAKDNWWYLPVTAEIEGPFVKTIDKIIEEVKHESKLT